MKTGRVVDPFGTAVKSKILAGAIVLCVLFGCGLPAGAFAAECTDTWTGPSEGSWQIAEDWSEGTVPTSSDVACIGSGKTVEVAGITGHAGIVQGEGKLVLSSTLVLESTIGSSNIGVLSGAGTLKGPGTVKVSGSFNWQGTLAGSGSTILASGATGILSLGPYSFVRQEERDFINQGTFTLTSGEILASEGAEIINEGTFIANEDAISALAAYNGGGPFVNNGTFKKTSGTGTTDIAVGFENKGTVDAQSGKFAFSEGGSSNASAEWESSEGSELRFTGGTFSLKGRLAGVVTVYNSTVVSESLDSSAALIALSSGTLNAQSGTTTVKSLTLEGGGILKGPATVNISSSLNWIGTGYMQGSGSTVILPGATASTAEMTESYERIEGRRIVNEGTFTAAVGEILLNEGAEILNTGTFTANEQSLTTIGVYGAGGTFVNSGVFQKTSGAGTSYIQIMVENKGTVDAQSGKFAFSEGGSSNASAEWESSEGSELRFTGGTFSLKGRLAGVVTVYNSTVVSESLDSSAALIALSSGTLNAQSGTTTVKSLTLEGGGILKGPATVNISSSLNWIGTGYMQGSGSTVILPGATASTAEMTESYERIEGRRIVNEGTFTAAVGEILLNEGAEILNTGTFTANEQSLTTIGVYGAGGTFVNSGVFQKTSGAGTSYIEPAFENLGAIKESSGNLKIEHPKAAAQSHHFSKECKAEDPVNCATGDFSESQTDIAVGGLGVGLDLTRTYGAQAAAAAVSPGAFGYGWTASFSDHLASEEEGKRVTLFSADGGTVPFTSTGGESFKAPNWSQDTLSGSAGSGYTLVLPEQTEYAFSGGGRLESVSDRNGNETTLAYNGSDQLETITDPAGRQITLTYNGSGEVESAEDPMGHVVEYGYEGGNLTSVTMPGEAKPRWQFEYDGSHRITKVTDGRGGKTKNEYDGSSRVISQTDPAGHTTKFEYAPFHTKITNEATGSVTDEWFTSNNEPFSITHGFGTPEASTETFSYNAAGLLTSKTDGDEHETTYGYDAHGNRTSEKDPDGDSTKWGFNEAHEVISFTTPGNETATIKRDGDGNVESISRPGPEKTTQTSTFAYDPQGQLESVTDPLKRTWSYGYDAQGDRTSETDPAGDTVTTEYDEDSRPIAIVSPRGNLEGGAKAAEYTTRIERDPQGRVEEVIDPLGHTTKYAYDANGNLEAETDANDNTTKYTYNADNERTEVEKPSGALLKTGYDAEGNVTSQTDADGKTTTYVRNVLGEPVEVIDPLTRKTTEEFDAAGNLKTIIDPEGRQTSYTYDPANRLTKVTYSDGTTPDVELEYNPDGNVLSMVDGTGESTYEYDQLGRLTRSEDGHGDIVGYKYDLAEELTGITYPNGESISRAFDEAGRLESVTDWLGGTTTFSYDPDSNLKSITFPAGSGDVDEYAYDRADRMSEASFKKGAESLASLSYSREEVGQIEEEVRHGLPGPEKVSYGYDEDSRLTSAGSSSYEYDPAGNLTKAPGTTNKYDAASELESGTSVSYEYDELGERVKATPSSGPTTSYEYNQAGNLISVERSAEGAIPAIEESFAYDGSGLLASRTAGLSTHYLTWDDSEGLPLLLSDGESSYIYGPDGLPIEQISSGETPTYLHHDQLGSTRLLTNAMGEASATFTYGPYGDATGHTGSATTPLGFAGQYTDSQSGLQYLRARFYDPATGQFLTKDPLVAVTNSLYGYSSENPLRYVDPTGMSCLSVGHFGPIEYPSVNPGDCVEEAVTGAGSGAEGVGSFAFNHASLVAAPVVFAACVIEPEFCTTAAVVGALGSGTAAGIKAANECSSIFNAEIDNLLVTLAAALPGGIFEATAGRAGPELTPVARRILQALLDAPGLGAESAHGAKSP